MTDTATIKALANEVFPGELDTLNPALKTERPSHEAYMRSLVLLRELVARLPERITPVPTLTNPKTWERANPLIADARSLFERKMHVSLEPGDYDDTALDKAGWSDIVDLMSLRVIELDRA